jgi:hypothetical protein
VKRPSRDGFYDLPGLEMGHVHFGGKKKHHPMSEETKRFSELQL